MMREAYQTKFRRALAVFLGENKDPTGVLRSIDEYAAEVRRSGQCDAVRWPYSMTWAISRRVDKSMGNSFDKQIKYLREYIRQRRPVLNKYFRAQ